ncbi:MAG: hypothetical protein M1831_007377 [Alyxoria varia]|nr:MAG: hypothetical protein M1831_007377 [Alyxoria varia]
MQSGLTKFDAPAHVAEEVKNASVKVPVAMILSVLFNGIQGLVVLVIARFYVDVHRGAELSDHRPQQPIVIAIGFALDRKLSVPGTIALVSYLELLDVLCLQNGPVNINPAVIYNGHRKHSFGIYFDLRLISLSLGHG